MTGLPLGHTHIRPSYNDSLYVTYQRPLERWNTYGIHCWSMAEVNSAIRTYRLYYEADHRSLPIGKYKRTHLDQFGRRVGRNGEGA